MTRINSKEKINAKDVFGHDRSSQQEAQEPKKTRPQSQPTQHLHTSKSQAKGNMYTTIQGTTTYVRDCMYCSPHIHMNVNYMTHIYKGKTGKN